MSNNEEFKELAAQLRQPHGEKGLQVAELMNETNIQMTLHAIYCVTVSDGDKILEIGHGNGGHLQHLLAENKNLVYYGLEISELMHQEAARRNQAFVEVQRAYFSLYDGRSIPFPDAFFDKVFTVNTIYFWTEPQLLLQELYRVLKEGGIMCITFAEEEFMRQLPFTQFGFELYSTEKLSRLIATTSFRIIRTETKTETVKTKTGEEVNRPFTTITIRK